VSLELRRALYNISALADLGQEVTSEKTFGERMQSALYAVMGTFLASKGAIFWLEKDKDKLVRVAHKGLEGSGAIAISGAHLLSLQKDEPCAISVTKDTASPDLPRSLRRALGAACSFLAGNFQRKHILQKILRS
jgi:hypothetical protein